MILIIILVVVLLIVIWCISTVNGFKKKEIRVQEGLSGVEVALTKRYDMLTKMLDTAKGYMAHENELFAKIIELRRGMSVEEMNTAAQQMDSLSGKLFAVQTGRDFFELGKSEANIDKLRQKFLGELKWFTDIINTLRVEKTLYKKETKA